MFVGVPHILKQKSREDLKASILVWVYVVAFTGTAENISTKSGGADNFPSNFCGGFIGSRNTECYWEECFDYSFEILNECGIN